MNLLGWLPIPVWPTVCLSASARFVATEEKQAMLDRKDGFGVATVVAALVATVSNAPAVNFDLQGSLGEAGFTHYVAPVSNPLFNETPYITTEVRPMWMHQNVPQSGGGGNIDVFAVQIRVAITDRLGFIATKDGWADLDFDHTLDDDGGAANLAFGFKYAAVAEAATNSLVTVALRYEAPSGGIRTSGVKLQGQGDGLFDLFVAAARTFGPVGLEANLGTQLAVDDDADTSFLHYAVHADWEVLERFYPFVEINGFTPIEDGNRTSLGVGGMDLVNLGATNSKTVVTVAPGVRIRVLDNLDIGAAFELPLTSEEDIMDWRATTDLVIHL